MNSLIVGNLKSKTSWLAIVILFLGVVHDNSALVADLLPDRWEGKAFGVIGLLLLFFRNLTTQSITQKATGGEAGFARPHLLLFIAFTSPLILSSCSILERRPAASSLGITYAVAKYIENSSADKVEQRRATIREIATAVKADTAAGEAVSVPLLRAAVIAKLAGRGLSNADLQLATGVVDTVAEELNFQLGNGILSPDQRLQVSKVMDWVIRATYPAGTAPTPTG